ncbi:MAG: hypothetical protein M3517_06315 [Actinomycetota bacterium]|nr:hypothetical protein [Actinomycetota bacterium]
MRTSEPVLPPAADVGRDRSTIESTVGAATGRVVCTTMVVGATDVGAAVVGVAVVGTGVVDVTGPAVVGGAPVVAATEVELPGMAPAEGAVVGIVAELPVVSSSVELHAARPPNVTASTTPSPWRTIIATRSR